MRKLFIYCFFLPLAVVMQSCLFSEDDLFEMSSAERETAAVEELKKVLLDSEYGWMMEYRYGSDGRMGAMTLLLKFDANGVQMASDFSVGDYNAGETISSLYSIKPYQGTLISFDTYNPIIHKMCEPNSYFDLGYQGDYEFVVRTVTDSEIIVTGKKSGVETKIKKINQPMDWKATLLETYQLISETDYLMFNVYSNGENIGRVLRDERAFVVETKDELGSVINNYYPFVVTNEGFKLIVPMSFDGKTIDSFKWQSDTKSFYNQELDVKMTFEKPADYDKYLGEYTIHVGEKKYQFTISAKKDGYTYEGIAPELGYNFDLYYDMAFTNDIVLKGGYVAVVDDQKLGLYVGNIETSSLSPTFVDFYGTTTVEDNKQVIRFTNAFAEDGLSDWFFLTNSNGMYSLISYWRDPVFIKN